MTTRSGSQLSTPRHAGVWAKEDHLLTRQRPWSYLTAAMLSMIAVTSASCSF
jgi:hypothetical protein